MTSPPARSSSRSIGGRSKRRCSRRTNLDRDLAQAVAGQTVRRAGAARHRASRAGRYLEDDGRGAQRHRGCRQGGAGEREGAAPVRDHHHPISGRTGALMVHEGNLVRGDQNALVVINQVAPISVTFAIPEARLPDLKKYMAVGALRVAANPPNDDGGARSRPHHVRGQLRRSRRRARSEVKGTFPNADRRLWPGQYVNVVVTLTTDPNAIVVPSVAVQAGQQGSFVFIVNAQQMVDLRPVTVARTSATETVIGSSLERPW